jgi:hypothetical protein
VTPGLLGVGSGVGLDAGVSVGVAVGLGEPTEEVGCVPHAASNEAASKTSSLTYWVFITAAASPLSGVRDSLTQFQNGSRTSHQCAEAWPLVLEGSPTGGSKTFLDPSEAQASALMSGTVLSADRRTVIQTGQEIVVAEVRTAGGLVVTVCLEGAAHSGLPPIGGVISGTVNMVASMESWHESPSTTHS